MIEVVSPDGRRDFVTLKRAKKLVHDGQARWSEVQNRIEKIDVTQGIAFRHRTSGEQIMLRRTASNRVLDGPLGVTPGPVVRQLETTV